MFSDIAIKVDSLSKCYQIYDKPHYRLLQMIMRGHRQYYREFWALRDISFSVNKGETVGIIGRNGSGKSTLLKMICGTLNPTNGNVTAIGRIAAILELGSGFNPEFTGRENVYMKGSILGLNSEQIDHQFQSIADFAEIGDFMDQPVRTYSSGMMVRLAFAVSVNVDPEILIVDEALSVGDERFQRKCFSRIESIRADGATILFVSHSGATVVQLCDRAILLDEGEKLMVGAPKEIYGRYQQLLYAPENKREEIRKSIISKNFTLEPKDYIPTKINRNLLRRLTKHDSVHEERENFDPNLIPSSTIAYESRGAHIHSLSIENDNGAKVNNLIKGRTYKYVYKVKFSKNARNVQFGMLIKTKSGVMLGGAVSAPTRSECIPEVKAGSEYEVQFLYKCSLNPGSYFLNAGVVGEIDESEEQIHLHRLLDGAMFKVQPIRRNRSTGIVDFECSAIINETTHDKVAN